MKHPAIVFSLGLVFGLLASVSAPAIAASQSASEGETNLADEVHVKQETGHYKNNKPNVPLGTAVKTAPEGAAPPPPAGATNPNTCDSKNATSPSCYTATQQGHK